MRIVMEKSSVALICFLEIAAKESALDQKAWRDGWDFGDAFVDQNDITVRYEKEEVEEVRKYVVRSHFMLFRLMRKL